MNIGHASTHNQNFCYILPIRSTSLVLTDCSFFFNDHRTRLEVKYMKTSVASEFNIKIRLSSNSTVAKYYLTIGFTTIYWSCITPTTRIMYIALYNATQQKLIFWFFCV